MTTKQIINIPDGARRGHNVRVMGAWVWMPERKPKSTKKKYNRSAIRAFFFMPRVKCIAGDKDQWRILHLNFMSEIEWLTEMQENYAKLSPKTLTTFFADHP